MLVGDLSPGARAGRRGSRALRGWARDRRPAPRRVLAPPPAVVGDDLLARHRPAAVQSQIRMSGAAVPRDDPGYPALQIANLVYGGYFSSRLVENIREDKGYTYSARSSLEFWPERAAVTVAFDTTSPSTAPALLEARYELGRISLMPPTHEEVDVGAELRPRHAGHLAGHPVRPGVHAVHAGRRRSGRDLAAGAPRPARRGHRGGGRRPRPP